MGSYPVHALYYLFMTMNISLFRSFFLNFYIISFIFYYFIISFIEKFFFRKRNIISQKILIVMLIVNIFLLSFIHLGPVVLVFKEIIYLLILFPFTQTMCLLNFKFLKYVSLIYVGKYTRREVTT